MKEKVVWIPELAAVFIADLHFGKAAHFRKSGIPIPEPIHYADLEQIGQLIHKLRPDDMYFLGDLFHSEWNEGWETLNRFLMNFPTVRFHLIKGNHDILPAEFYGKSVFIIHNEPIELADFILSHEPMKDIPAGKLNLCGHIHPGIRMTGRGRQSLRIPCFHLRQNQLTLPAFGNFTGLAMIRPAQNDSIYGITPEKVIQIL